MIELSATQAIIIFALIIAILPMFVSFTRNSKIESVKLESLNANITAAENIRKDFKTVNNKSVIESYISVKGLFNTYVSELTEIEVSPEIPHIYRVVISTTHLSNKLNTELTIYL